MKKTYSEIINILIPALQNISEMQQKGLVSLSAKVASNLAKNQQKATIINKKFQSFRLEKMTIFIVVEDNIFKTHTVNNELEYVFNADCTKQELDKIINDFIAQEIDWDPHKTSTEELDKIDNFPIAIRNILTEFDMLTELSLETASLKILK